MLGVGVGSILPAACICPGTDGMTLGLRGPYPDPVTAAMLPPPPEWLVSAPHMTASYAELTHHWIAPSAHPTAKALHP